MTNLRPLGLPQQFADALYHYKQGELLEGNKIVQNMPKDVQQSICEKIQTAARRILKDTHQFGELSFLNTKSFDVMPTNACLVQALRLCDVFKPKYRLCNIFIANMGRNTC